MSVPEKLISQINDLFQENPITPENITSLCILVMEYTEGQGDLSGEEKENYCIELINNIIHSPRFQDRIINFPMVQFVVNTITKDFIKVAIDVSKKVYNINRNRFSKVFKCCK